jgi:hypothetical protein
MHDHDVIEMPHDASQLARYVAPQRRRDLDVMTCQFQLHSALPSLTGVPDRRRVSIWVRTLGLETVDGSGFHAD